MKLVVAHINNDPKPNPVKELSRILGEKWRRKDKQKAEKEYAKRKTS